MSCSPTSKRQLLVICRSCFRNKKKMSTMGKESLVLHSIKLNYFELCYLLCIQEDIGRSCTQVIQ